MRGPPLSVPLGVSLVCALLGAVAEPARAQPTVIVVGAEDEELDETFLGTVRVQVGARARIETGARLRGDTLSARMTEAARTARARSAAIVLFMERSAAGDRVEVVVHAVGRDAGRALVEIARLSRLDRPDDYRALGLKVASFLDTLLWEAPGRSALARTYLEAETARAAEAIPRLVLEVGGAAAIGSPAAGPELALRAAAGVSSHVTPARLDALAVVRWVPTFEVRQAERVVAIDEVAAGARVRGALDLAPFVLGVAVEATARFMSARGIAPDGRTGRVSRIVPAVRAGIEPGVAFAPLVEIHAFVGVEVAVVRQSFSVLGERVADMGRTRGVAELSLVVSAP